jgi:uncharacterized membrane protein YjdF
MFKYLSALIILAFVLKGHLLGLAGWYYRMPFFDIAMHILAGAAIALLFSAFIDSRFLPKKHGRWIIVGGTMAVGIIWELFEAYYGLTGYKVGTQLYQLDTAKDLLDDLLGATLVAFSIIRTRR